MHKAGQGGGGGNSNKSYSSQSAAPVSDDDPEFDPDEGKAEIIIGKHRNGPVGTIKLGFQPEYARFTNLAKEEFWRRVLELRRPGAKSLYLNTGSNARFGGEPVRRVRFGR